MIRILLVEDDEYKRSRVLATLSRADGLRVQEQVEVAANVFDAARMLKERRHDVLILDIALPLRADGEPQSHAGIDFLEDLLRHPEDGLPGHVIGITAYKDIYEKCANQFASWLLTLVHFDGASDDWEKALIARIEHILDASSAIPPYQADLAILCALETPELQAVLRLPWGWRREPVIGDHAIYYRGGFQGRNGRKTAIAVAAPRKGMPTTIYTASKLIHNFRPKYLAMVGIAAAVKGRAELGDILVANPCWDSGHGKWVSELGSARFLPAPFQLQLDGLAREQLRECCNDSQALASIREGWVGERPKHPLSARLGPVASGAAVLADAVTLARIVEQHRELLGFEMEAYGVFVACEEASAPRPIALVAKAAVDFGDQSKGDRFQAYASYTSAQFLALFAQKYV